MSQRGKPIKPTPIIDEGTMAALRDYFYDTFWESLNAKDVEISGLKRVADKCAADSPLREVLLELPDRVSRVDMQGLVYPLTTLAKREDRIRRAQYC
ncbi:MAG: hypothetical protein OK438_08945 [Thaumarchaeota archaeon]|nr:hypothetical protein [Nitrososphaerota archaeon]